MTVWTYNRVLLADIIAEVAHVFRVPEAALKGRSRSRRIVKPRFVCCYLGHRLTYLSYPQIGALLGNRDHSSIIHGKKDAEYHIGRDPEFRAYVDAVRIRLLTTHQRTEQRLREAARRVREQEEAERIETEAANPIVPNDMDDLSNAVAAYRANGGSFVEVYA